MSTSGQSENFPVLSSVIAYFSSSLWMLHCVQSCLYSDLIHIQWNLCKRFHTLRFAEVSEKHLGRPEYIQGRWSERYSFLWNLRANKGGTSIEQTRNTKAKNSKFKSGRKAKKSFTEKFWSEGGDLADQPLLQGSSVPCTFRGRREKRTDSRNIWMTRRKLVPVIGVFRALVWTQESCK